MLYTLSIIVSVPFYDSKYVSLLYYLLLFLNDYLLADIFGGGTDEEGEGTLDGNELMTSLIPEG